MWRTAGGACVLLARRGDLIVAKETWYRVKLKVDPVLKGKLKHAKRPDLGMLPAMLTPPMPAGEWARVARLAERRPGKAR